MTTRQPPYPGDVRAKGWRFELDHERIRQSDTWALASAEVRPWLLMLWMTAWEQTPCGSLPADDELIAARIGMPMKTFAKHKHCLMRGWWLAEDGRQYHDTLVERVAEMLGAKEKERNRKATYRLRMDAERAAASDGSDALSHGTSTGQTRDSHGSDPGRDDTGTGTGTISSSLRSEDQKPTAIAVVKKKPRSQLPDDFWPNEAGIVAANRLQLDSEVEAFRNHHLAKGSLMADWQAAWRTWAANARKFAKPHQAALGETPWQRSQRERVAELSPGVARRDPNLRPVTIIEGESRVTSIAGR